MSGQRRQRCKRCHLKYWGLAFLVGLITIGDFGVPPGRCGDTQSSSEQRGQAVGMCADTSGPILRRPAGKSTWDAIKAKQLVNSDDLLVALGYSSIEGKNKAVRLTLLGNLAHDGTSPVWESAVIVRSSPEVDLDFTLDRGRVSLSNHKASGAARVRVHYQGQTLELGLPDKDTRVALETSGFWPAGVPFARDAKSGPEPIRDLLILVLQGQADLKSGTQQFALSAPPGPALYRWNSASGLAPGPMRLAEAPSWTTSAKPTTVGGKKALIALQQIELRVVDMPVPNALAQPLVDSVDPIDRRLAVYGLGAIDDLQRLVQALGDEKHTDVRAEAILALRHWISRGPGQDQKLYDALVKQSKYTAGQAEIVLQLLHVFGERDLERPETYETLIAYLGHAKLPIRELASWHLYRMAPAGKGIKYDAASSEESRNQAVKQWKELIPEGKLPPKSRPESK